MLKWKNISRIYRGCFFFAAISSAVCDVLCELDAYKKCAWNQIESFETGAFRELWNNSILSERLCEDLKVWFSEDIFSYHLILFPYSLNPNPNTFSQTAWKYANMVWTPNWTTKVQNDLGGNVGREGVRWRAISSKTELTVEARWGLQDWLGKHAVVKIKGGIRLQHHRERHSQDTPVGMVLVASLHASFRRRILRNHLEKEGPVIDGVDYSNLLSAMFKKDSSCFSNVLQLKPSWWELCNYLHCFLVRQSLHWNKGFFNVEVFQ